MNEYSAKNSLLPVTTVSLGSNGFHLISAVQEGNSLKTTVHLHENVQVESCLDENLMISPVGRDRILGALGRFANHLQGNPSAIVGAIATGSFRRAIIESAFFARLNEPVAIAPTIALGFP